MREQLDALEEQGASDIEEQLSLFFAIDLYLHLLDNDAEKCVLFFDTYELLWKKGRGEANKLQTDAWVRRLAEKTRLLENKVIFVLSGHEKLQWQLAREEWPDIIEQFALDVLAPDFAKRYLEICGITDTAIQDSIIKAAQGHPYYLDLCVDTYYSISV